MLLIAPLWGGRPIPAAHACRGYGAPVATDREAVSVAGRPVRSTHRNPAGISCQILTFSRTTNVETAGDATEEFTWFEGYAWRAAGCVRCNLHLGWRYEEVRSPLVPREFYGLLVEALRGASDAGRDM